ncbi:MAG: hypothetical protein AAGB26_04000 [Planctomycetota bacterium]
MRLIQIITIALLIATTPVSAQDQENKVPLPDDAVKFSRPKIALYDKLFLFDEEELTGAGSEVKSDKFRFLHIRLVINYKLPEGSEDLNINSRNISLVQDGGKTHPAIGSFDDNKVFSDWARGLWLHVRDNRRNEMFDIVYAIPADAKGPYALVIDDLKTLRIEVPKKAVDPPHPADMVDVEVKSVAWGDSVPGETIRVGNEEIKTKFTVPGRRLLAVSLLVHAQDYNDDEGKRLNWSGRGLAIRDKSSQVYPTHGGFFANTINRNIGHNSEVGKKSTDPETFFFSPPDGIESFDVLWYGRPVTTYQIKK